MMDNSINQPQQINTPERGKLVMSQHLVDLVGGLNSLTRRMGAGSNIPSHNLGHHVIMVQITNAADGGGVYAARRVYVDDAGTFDPADPAAPADLLTDSGDDDFIIMNPAEAGSSGHLIDDGEYVGIVRTGVAYGDLEIGIIIGFPNGNIVSPTTIGAASEGSESASSTTWNRDDGSPLEEWYVSRVGYWHAGDEKLYAFYRKRTYDTLGALRSVSAETRVEIDAPEDC